MAKYNVNYKCGCIHELEEKEGQHKPTGNNKNCEEHKTR